jgi:D-psicose/D-tagatose/L-ribulose 3-epimerase
MYDTFHSNIEEKDPIAALHAAAPYSALIHISENDRGTPGQGNIPWKETFQAIKDVKYDGWIVVEAFGLALPALQAATKIWRRMYESEEQLSRDALKHLKAGLMS